MTLSDGMIFTLYNKLTIRTQSELSIKIYSRYVNVKKPANLYVLIPRK